MNVNVLDRSIPGKYTETLAHTDGLLRLCFNQNLFETDQKVKKNKIK